VLTDRKNINKYKFYFIFLCLEEGMMNLFIFLSFTEFYIRIFSFILVYLNKIF